jgi:hypothetical protein
VKTAKQTACSTAEALRIALDGGEPPVTPLSVYDWFIDDMHSPAWQRLFEMGLGVCRHVDLIKYIEHGVENTVEETTREGRRVRTLRKITPVGEIRRVSVDGWHVEHWLKTPEDYRVCQWIFEHSTLEARYDEFAQAQAEIGENGIVVVLGSRTPAMTINVDWAGTEQFCLDVAMDIPELRELYEVRKALFMEETRLIAAGPGRFVKWLENLTISMLGPQRYRDLLLPVYAEATPILAEADKRVMVHYDGALSPITDDIAAAPLHIIESLTEPPEGDMTLDQCRLHWPDKAFWCNLNVDLYDLPPEQLASRVGAARDRAGKCGLAFEISEDLPANWQQSVPLVLDALKQLP